MNIEIEDLKKTDPHPLQPLFTKYSRSKVAAKLDIAENYLGNILNGHLRPGPKLSKRMRILALKIKRAEKHVGLFPVLKKGKI